MKKLNSINFWGAQPIVLMKEKLIKDTSLDLRSKVSMITYFDPIDEMSHNTTGSVIYISVGNKFK